MSSPSARSSWACSWWCWAFVVDRSEDSTRAAPETTLGSALDDPRPDVYRGPTPEASPAANIEDRVDDALDVGGTGLGTPPGGLSGTGGTKNLPKERVTLTMSSDAPIGVIGFVVPTSLDHRYGVVEDAGTSWSISTVAYDNPDYAQLFAQSGPTGAVITCTIMVNGEVTQSRSTDGPYSQLFCQG